MNRIVLGYGPTPSAIMAVGEAPGREESARERPFVGRSGQELRSLLSRHSLTNPYTKHSTGPSSTIYLTNLCKEYTLDNPDPTPSQILEWSPVLEREIIECQPLLILGVGRFAAQWLIDDYSIPMSTMHGIPHRYKGGSYPRNLPLPVVVPCYHPAAGFYDPTLRSFVNYDFEQAGLIWKQIKYHQPINYPCDDISIDQCAYVDVTGAQMAAYIEEAIRSIDYPKPLIVDIDTEGYETDPWSIQVTLAPGESAVLRYQQADFSIGIESIQRAIDDRAIVGAVSFHNLLHDLAVCRSMGLTFAPSVQFIDTMYAAYLIRLIPQGLKPLEYRYFGVRQKSFIQLVGKSYRGRQLAYVKKAQQLTVDWSKLEPREVKEKDGTIRLYKPQSIQQRLKGIVRDVDNNKVNKSGEPTDIKKRWMSIDEHQRLNAESILGRLPGPSLSDIPLNEAINYAGSDSDYTARLRPKLANELQRLSLTSTFNNGMRVIQIFEDMQRNGMPGSRQRFIDLHEYLQSKMDEHRRELSEQYFNGQHINPSSDKQTLELMNELGLIGEKLTKKKRSMSTAKDSIEHLRYDHPAIDLLFKYREHAHIDDSFTQPSINRLKRLDPLVDIHDIKGRIQVTRTHTRRPAMKSRSGMNEPNYLNIPSRTELGRMVRKCYVTRPGEIFYAADLSQIEYRLFAHLTQDPLLLQFFRDGRDIHREMAAKSRGIDPAEVTNDQRSVAKEVNFGTIYLISPHGLHVQMRKRGLADEWTIEKCASEIDLYWSTFSRARDWTLEVEKRLLSDGYVRDHGGMYRYLPGIWDHSPAVRAESLRMGVNHLVQGGAAEMIQRSMEWLWPKVWQLTNDYGYDIKWRLQVYDELIFTCKDDPETVEILDGLVVEALTNHYFNEGSDGERLSVPVLAEGKTADNWGELK